MKITKKNNLKKNNNTRKIKNNNHKKTKICQIKNGLGNKIFILVNIINKYKDYKIYFYEEKSHHQIIDPETLLDIFPYLKNYKNIEFVSLDKFNQLKKKGIEEIEYTLYIYTRHTGFLEEKNFIKKYLKINEKYNYLLKKYDFKNGIFVHVRYGDKIEITYKSLINREGYVYNLLKSEYYIYYIKELLKKNKTAPVYIFTDSQKITKCLLEKELPTIQFVNERTVETFFCFYHCNNLIMSHSTLPSAAVCMRNDKNLTLIYPLYNPIYFKDKILKTIILRSGKGIPYFLFTKKSYSTSNSKYLLNNVNDIEEIFKKCDIKFPE
jgi:hypothetical protein